LDKESTSYVDIFDAFRLVLKLYQFANMATEGEDMPVVVNKKER
jgi:hypothetical protein